MTRPVVIVPRWLGHGDIRVVMDLGAGPLLLAGDVCTVLEIDVDRVWNERAYDYDWLWPAPVVPVGGMNLLVNDPPAEFFTVEATRHVAENNPSYLTADFIAWLDEFLGELDAVGVEEVVDAASPTPEAALGRTYSVRLAAKVLSRDRAIDLGQESLFAVMQNFGWTQRINNTWQPDPIYIKRGFMVLQGRRVPGRKELYPQIRLTVDGILELHKKLHGINTLHLDEPDHLTLVEI